MMKKRKILILFAMVTLITVISAAGCSGKENPPTAAETSAAETSAGDGDKSSDETSAADAADAGTASRLGSLKSFSAGTLDGGSFTQDDIAAKDVTVINFWSLTCGPCIVEMPDLAAFAKALPDNVQVVTVCLDGRGNEDIAESILAEAGFEGATLISGDGDLITLCGNLQYTPTTLIVDSEGGLVGNAIIGGQKDLSKTLLAAVNGALKMSGKAEISLEE